jgi:hypothetical protein
MPPTSTKGRSDNMRDEMDARFWTAHHDLFSTSVETGIRAFARRLGKIEPGRGIAGQLIAIMLAGSLTLITFGASIAAS